MNDDDTVNWERLPHRAEEFFGLTPGYDRKQLKRAYNRWVKRFKPEKFPEEFKRIREAFEGLDESLRYGGSDRILPFSPRADVATEPDTTVAPFGDSAENSSQQLVSVPFRCTIRDRLAAGETPANLVADIEGLPHKLAEHYVVLALLGDSAAGTRFTSALIEGLSQFPNDAGLLELIQSHCRSVLARDEAEFLVRELATVLPVERYYYFTEPLWLELCRNRPFSVVKALLIECQDRLGDLVGSPSFYLRVVVVLLWDADVDWVDDKVALIYDHSDELEYTMGCELAILDELLAYRDHRDAFIRPGGLRAQIDAMIRQCSDINDTHFDRHVIQNMLTFSQDTDALIDAFPMDDAAVESSAFALLNMFAGEVIERIEPPDVTLEPESRLQRVMQVASRLQRAGSFTVNNCVWTIAALSSLVLQAVVMLLPLWPIVARAMKLVDDWWFYWVIAAAAIIWIVAFFRYIRPPLDAYTRERPIFFFSKRQYIRHWRRELVRFFRTSHMDLASLLHAFDTIDNMNDDRFSSCSWYKHYAMHDPALWTLDIVKRCT